VTPSPGTLILHIDDTAVRVDVVGGGTYALPIGPVSLISGPLGDDDPPSPAELTNALGFVQDHVDDLVIESPSVVSAPSVIAVGEHAMVMARVEIGADIVPEGYELLRADADEVFRTLVNETTQDRVFNPGLDAAHAVSVVGTCCVILGIMRRLDLPKLHIAPSSIAPSNIAPADQEAN